MSQCDVYLFLAIFLIISWPPGLLCETSTLDGDVIFTTTTFRPTKSTTMRSTITTTESVTTPTPMTVKMPTSTTTTPNEQNSGNITIKSTLESLTTKNYSVTTENNRQGTLKPSNGITAAPQSEEQSSCGVGCITCIVLVLLCLVIVSAVVFYHKYQSGTYLVWSKEIKKCQA